MLELWGIQSIPSLSLLPGPLWPGVVAPDRVLSVAQITFNSQTECKQMICQTELFEIEPFDHLTVCKHMIDA